MTMKAEDAKEAAEPRQVAADHALEVRHAPEPPVLEIGGGQPPQPDDHIDRRDDLAACENRSYRALYLRVLTDTRGLPTGAGPC